VFCSTKEVQDEIEKETEVLATAILNIDLYIPIEKQKTMEIKLDWKLICKKFINFLQYGVNNTKNKSTIITLLKVLKRVIEKE
jgi:hypothetical protein